MEALSNAATFLGRPQVLAALCAVLLPVSSYLASDLAITTAKLRELETAVDRETNVAVGTRILSLTGFSLNGDRAHLVTTPSRRGALIFGLSGSCSYCIAELDLHRRLAADAEARGLSVYWILRDSLDESRSGPYDRAASPGVLIVEPVNQTHRLVGLGFTPQTVVLTTTGVVDGSWRGVLGASGEAKISEAIRRVSSPPVGP